MSGAHNALMYGHTWYLDAVTYLPGWRWEGLVITDILAGEAAQYEAVLPIPLRRRWGRWVVYQPLFCQFLAVFSAQQIDVTPFIQAVFERYRHVSTWHLLLHEPLPGLPAQVRQQVLHTHVLALVGDVSYAISWRYGVTKKPIYTPDRQMNLRRAVRRVANVPNWRVAESTDIEPLLALFRENHAPEIGVGDWAYAVFRQLFGAIQERGLGTLQYAWAGGKVVAGAYFVAQHGRIVYLFNAADAEGRRLNARSILIDGMIRAEQEKAVTESMPTESLLDFESPEKPGVVSFYESFGATAQPYVRLSWSRLTWAEQLAKWVLKKVRR